MRAKKSTANKHPRQEEGNYPTVASPPLNLDLHAHCDESSWFTPGLGALKEFAKAHEASQGISDFRLYVFSRLSFRPVTHLVHHASSSGYATTHMQDTPRQGQILSVSPYL